MINGISSATSGLRAATAQFERAAAATTSAAQSEESASPDQSAAPAQTSTNGDMLDGMVGMISARLAFSASLVALRASTDLLAEAFAIGGYGVSANELR